jgi:16S rRNA U516 pseudouridylate synthase RsuA-like enzyme
MAEMRLQKFLSRAGICSRRKGEEYIKAGWVKVNGEIVTELGVKVDPERDAVEVDSDAIRSDSTPISKMKRSCWIFWIFPRESIPSDGWTRIQPGFCC